MLSDEWTNPGCPGVWWCCHPAEFTSGGADRCLPVQNTHTHLDTPRPPSPAQRARYHRLAGVSVSLLKIWCSWAQPAPEFINLHLKDNSGTSRRPYVLWLLDSFPPLGFSARRGGQFNNTCRWPVVFLHSYYYSLILISSGAAELMLHP